MYTKKEPVKDVLPVIDILTDLIKINSDRIFTYRQAVSYVKNTDFELVEILKDIVRESEFNIQQLSDALKVFGNNIHIKPKIPGKIYAAWAELKAAFKGHEHRLIVASCEHNEDIVQHAYNTALIAYANMNENVYNLILEQKIAAKKNLYLIQTCGDSCHVFY